MSALAAVASAAPARAADKAMIPANFNVAPNDSQGFRWDVQHNGQISNGTNSTFSNAGRLYINGNDFNQQQAMMTPDGTEYLFTGQAPQGGISVARRVKVDVKAAAVRYVEELTNATSAPQTVALMVYTHLGQSQAQALITNTGKPPSAGVGNPAALAAMHARFGRSSNSAAFSLDKKETGFIAFSPPNTSQLSVLFWLGGARSKEKPAIQAQNNYQFNVTWSLTIPPGKTVAVAHGLAQRRLNAPPQGKELTELFKPFEHRNWTRDIPSALRKAIVNLGGAGGGLGSGGETSPTLEALDVTPGTSDVLALGEQTRINGTAAAGEVAVETRYGRVSVPLERVAAIVGEKHAGGRPRVYLRDGQILSGPLAVGELHFTMTTGLQVALSPRTLDRLVMQAAPHESKAAPEVFALVETVEGDRLAVVRGASATLRAMTPWGDRQIAVEEIASLAPTEELLGHRLQLRDGTRMFAYLDPATLTLDTQFFGTQTFSPTDLRGMTAVDRKADEEDDAEPTLPYVLLAGDNLLTGQLDLPAIDFVAAGQSIPVPPSQIRVLRNAGLENDSAAGDVVFEGELWDGGLVAGALKGAVVPLRTGDRVVQIPVRDIVEVHVPVPTVPEGVREQIAALIRDLGSPDFEKREAASQALENFGQLAKLQLSDTVKATNDVEVRRRAQSLLDGL